MKKKKIMIIFIPILLVMVIVGFLVGCKFKNDEISPSENNNETRTYSYNNIYLLDKEDVLIPLSIKYQSFDSIGEELLYLIDLLKVDSSVTNAEFNGVLPKDCFVKSLDFTDGLLTLNFNESFKNYDPKKELRLLESIIWTLCDYQGVDAVCLSIEDKILTNMPNNNTPISNRLTKHFGINNYLLTSSIINYGEMVLSYYEKQINDKFYYVPVTHYVTNKNQLSIYDLTISTLFKNPGITSNLSVCRIFEDTSILSSSILTDNILYLSLSEDILYDEATVSLDVYNILKQTTCLLDGVDDVSFLLELQEIPVNGNLEQDEGVSKVEINKFYV